MYVFFFVPTSLVVGCPILPTPVDRYIVGNPARPGHSGHVNANHLSNDAAKVSESKQPAAEMLCLVNRMLCSRRAGSGLYS